MMTCEYDTVAIEGCANHVQTLEPEALEYNIERCVSRWELVCVYVYVSICTCWNAKSALA